MSLLSPVPLPFPSWHDVISLFTPLLAVCSRWKLTYKGGDLGCPVLQTSGSWVRTSSGRRMCLCVIHRGQEDSEPQHPTTTQLCDFG